MSAETGPPTLAGMQLIVEGLGACSGAAFELQDGARESEVLAFDGWEAEVAEGQKIVLVRGGAEERYDDAFPTELATAQKALDLMAMSIRVRRPSSRRRLRKLFRRSTRPSRSPRSRSEA